MTNLLQKIGLFLFGIALAIFTLSMGLSTHDLTQQNTSVGNDYHDAAISEQLLDVGAFDQTYNGNVRLISDVKEAISSAQTQLREQAATEGMPDGVAEWDYKIGDWKVGGYTESIVRSSASGLVPENKGLFLLLTFGLGIIGGLCYIIPLFAREPGIKHDYIYHDSLTRGLRAGWRAVFLTSTIIGILVNGISYMSGTLLWSVATGLLVALIIGLVMYYHRSAKRTPARSASPQVTGWIGILAGLYLIGFYVLLYWQPAYLSNAIMMVDPVSERLSGGTASRWFLYGLLYTVIVVVMGVRMLSKYQHNKYQRIRTYSVMFFQTAFAFLIPEILVRLNQPYFDFKNIWPLNYTFFFDYNLNNLISSGGLGIFMLVWGIALIVIAVPVITYFYGKRWYCSWVCGCGGLAETMGDPYRQLSDKSLRAWQYERYIIHGVLLFAVVMTIMVLYHYFTGNDSVLGISSGATRQWYGFLIGSAFAGVVGTGFYPLMGNRVWCRFGCPLAAYLGLVQRFKSRFRITTNGGQCISCGNCSTYCEMGIDVRHYAQRGQDIVRSSCVGCGVCAAVCPRGVLRLENGSSDIGNRAQELRVIHITESEVGIL